MTIFGIRICRVNTIREEVTQAVIDALLLNQKQGQAQVMDQEEFWSFLVDRELEAHPQGRYHA